MIEFLKILTLVKGYSKHAILNVFFNVLGMLFSAFSIILLIPIMEILFNQDGKVQKILENKPITNFFEEGYSLKEHGFYFLAEQIQLNDQSIQAWHNFKQIYILMINTYIGKIVQEI